MRTVAALMALLVVLPKPWGDAVVLFALTYMAAKLLFSISHKGGK